MDLDETITILSLGNTGRDRLQNEQPLRDAKALHHDDISNKPHASALASRCGTLHRDKIACSFVESLAAHSVECKAFSNFTPTWFGTFIQLIPVNATSGWIVWL
jgi:hypothetical protein